MRERPTGVEFGIIGIGGLLIAGVGAYIDSPVIAVLATLGVAFWYFWYGLVHPLYDIRDSLTTG